MSRKPKIQRTHEAATRFLSFCPAGKHPCGHRGHRLECSWQQGHYGEWPKLDTSQMSINRKVGKEAVVPPRPGMPPLAMGGNQLLLHATQMTPSDMTANKISQTHTKRDRRMCSSKTGERHLLCQKSGSCLPLGGVTGRWPRTAWGGGGD